MKRFVSVLALSSFFALGACNSQQKTEELVQAKIDAEKAKELASQVQELKTANDELKKENESLKLELATLKGRTTAQEQQRSRVAANTPAKKKAPAKDDSATSMSPAEKEQLKEQVTGGSALK